jgi:hypothetical protein
LLRVDPLGQKATTAHDTVDLEKLGVTVRYAGKDLAQILREGRDVLTF